MCNNSELFAIFILFSFPDIGGTDGVTYAFDPCQQFTTKLCPEETVVMERLCNARLAVSNAMTCLCVYMY